ncbi:MAG: aldo/keto reductase [Canibacter sp.]
MNDLAVPHIQLNDGRVIPQLGLGTYKLRGDEAYRVVTDGIELGYRHIDTAKLYKNETEIGRAIADSGVLREDIFVTTKVWPSEYDDVAASVEASLDRLGLESCDLILLHWPVPMFGTAWKAWDDLLEIRVRGLARSVGVSNFEIPHLERIIESSGVAPAVNQIELHPELQRRELVEYCETHGIAREAWGPIARARNELFGSEAVISAAQAHDVSPAQVVLRWHIQHGTIVFPKTSSIERLQQNADIFSFTLNDEEMHRVDQLDANVRLGGDPETYEANL